MILISVFTTRVPGEGYLETHVVYTEINIKRFFFNKLENSKAVTTGYTCTFRLCLVIKCVLHDVINRNYDKYVN